MTCEAIEGTFICSRGRSISKTALKPCPYRVLVERNESGVYHRSSMPCSNASLSNGWCQAHQESFAIMEAGLSAKYPALCIGAMEIGEGYASWLAFAVLARQGRAKQIKNTLNMNASKGSPT